MEERLDLLRDLCYMTQEIPLSKQFERTVWEVLIHRRGEDKRLWKCILCFFFDSFNF